MTTVESILKSTRLELGYEITEVAKKTKLPIKYLQAFESGDFHRYPQEPYCSLLIKDYADFLGLNGQEIVRLFRRDFIQKNAPKNAIVVPKGITPKYVFSLAVSLVVIGFVVYLFNEYLRFSKPPQLVVNWPKLLTSDTIQIDGKTSSDATVRINQDLVIVSPDGTFTKKISLDGPTIKVIVESKSPAGKVTTEEKILSQMSQ